MDCIRLLLLLACLGLPAGSACTGEGAGRLAVDVANRSEPVLCAEKDNVSLAFFHPQVTRFRIEAMHPVYLSPGQRDRQAPDWTDCGASVADPVHPGGRPPGKMLLYREAGFWIVGQRLATFWRPASAVVRVGSRVDENLHLLQVWKRRPVDGRAEEILVLYPQDGYWRARPFAPLGLPATAYGSSFLIGPVEMFAGRPLVQLREVCFEPRTRSFILRFLGGGTGRLKLVSVDQDRLVLDVDFEHPVGPGPFAMLRSMYVTESNNDVARIAVREPGAKGWREDGIMRFRRAEASEIWVGRLTPSRHNTSSPDLIFSRFSGSPGAVAK